MVGDIKDKLKASGGGNQEPQGDMKIFDSACSVHRPYTYLFTVYLFNMYCKKPACMLHFIVIVIPWLIN